MSVDQIKNAFQRDNLIVYTNPSKFKEFLFAQNLDNSALLLMSSGNYASLDLEYITNQIK